MLRPFPNFHKIFEGVKMFLDSRLRGSFLLVKPKKIIAKLVEKPRTGQERAKFSQVELQVRTLGCAWIYL